MCAYRHRTFCAPNFFRTASLTIAECSAKKPPQFNICFGLPKLYKFVQIPANLAALDVQNGRVGRTNLYKFLEIGKLAKQICTNLQICQANYTTFDEFGSNFKATFLANSHKE